MNRDEALALQHEWVASASLRGHMLAVAACVKAYALEWGEDAALWEVVALLHDFDYERHPDLSEHPYVGVEELHRRGVDEVICRAILSHGDHTGVPRLTRLEQTLYACDELAGFIVAVALMRPEKLAGMTARSVRKKMKQKSFAAAVNRDDIVRGAEELGVALDAHIDHCIAALQPLAADLGLEA